MRKLLLVGTAMAAMSFALPAFAGGQGGGDPQGGQKQNPTFELSIAAALAGNSAYVEGNHAAFYSESNAANISGGSYNGAKGVSNTNQNAGANSALENALALAYIQGCNCATSPTYTVAAGGALAGAGNEGSVSGNTETSDRSITGYTKVSTGGGPGGMGPQDEGMGPGGPGFILVPIYGPANYVTAKIDSSYNSVTGVFQVNQNAGDNSLLQNSAAVAAANGLKGVTDIGGAVALAGNDGSVVSNTATANYTNTAATINNSFNSAQGVINVNQNVGANSLLQNAASLASLQFCNCATDNLSLSVAAAGNDGAIYGSGNWASASNGSNSASLTDSFAGTSGMLSVSQNAGANSLLQNSVSVGVITH